MRGGCMNKIIYPNMIHPNTHISNKTLNFSLPLEVAPRVAALHKVAKCVVLVRFHHELASSQAMVKNDRNFRNFFPTNFIKERNDP